MKHLLLIVPAILVAYVLWHIATPKDRRIAGGFIARHGLKLAAILLVVVLLVAAAVHIPAPNIF